MPRFRFPVTMIALSALFLSLAGSRAQGNQIEIGMDMGLELWESGGETVWILSIPGNSTFSYMTGFRVGFPVSQKVRIEPSIGLDYLSSEGEDLHNIRLVGSIVADLGSDPSRTMPFLTIGAGVRNLGGDGDSESQFMAGGGFGFRTPIASNLSTRISLTYMRAFETDVFNDVNVFDVRFGFSFFVGG